MKFTVIFISLLIFITSCSTGPNGKRNKQEEDSSMTIDEIKAELNKTTKSIFYNMFLPCEMIYLFQKGGIKYNSQLINPISKIPSYTTNNKKALNLGVLGVDFGYLKIHDQFQDLKVYSENINKLANDLGIPQEHVKEILTYFQTDKATNDSLYSLTCRLYEITDTYLNQNERQATAALIILGGWIEALYITTQMMGDNDDQEIINRVAAQKYTLNSMISLLKINSDDLLIANYLVILGSLKNIYDNIDIYFKDQSDIEIDTVNRMISTYNSEIHITPEQYKKIEEIILKIRTHIVN